jgi:hypothetical protein
LYGKFKADISWGLALKGIFIIYSLFYLVSNIIKVFIRNNIIKRSLILSILVISILPFIGSIKIYPNRILLILIIGVVIYTSGNTIVSKIK